MKLGSFLLLIVLFGFSNRLFSQSISDSLKFEKGQTWIIGIQLKTTITQEAMGQAIDFNLEGGATHLYRVTNAAPDSVSMHHEVQQIAFNFDGMGQKRSFDSKNETDMSGEFGKPIKEILAKSYDMTIDPKGTVLAVKPEKFDSTRLDDRLAIINSMLKDLLDIVEPPQKNEASFFKVLSSNAIDTNSSWTDSSSNSSGKSNTTYTVDTITDTTIVLHYTGTSLTISKMMMMGNETTMTMNNKSSGMIILNRNSGIIREKTTKIESNGSMEVLGGSVPVTSKTASTTTVSVSQ